MQQRKVLTKVKRGETLYGEVVDTGSKTKLTVEIYYRDKLYKSSEVDNDQDAAELELTILMDDTHRELAGVARRGTVRSM